MGKPKDEGAEGGMADPRDSRVLLALETFTEVDRQVRELQSDSGLDCVPACGACCLSPEVFASVAECLPMAHHLVAEDRAAALLERIDSLPVPSPCVVHEPSAGNPGSGRCGAYAVRPIVCRVFGFARKSARDGRQALATCRRIREASPESTSLAEAAVATRGAGPSLTEATLALRSSVPGPDSALLPINQALRLALEQVLFRRHLLEHRGAPQTPPG